MRAWSIGRRTLLWTLLLQLATPGPLWADGGVLQAVGVEGAVEVKAQRALIWQRFDTLELVIEPVFRWSGEGVWVIPLAALPEVSAVPGCSPSWTS